MGYRLERSQSEPAVVLLERDLRRRLELTWQREPGDTCLLGESMQPQYDREQPGGIDFDVVVGERDDLSAGGSQPAVASCRDSGKRLAHQTSARDLERGGAGGTVVDDDHLVIG